MTFGYADRMSIQVAVKLPEAVVEEVDRLVREGRFANRTDAVRAALDRMLSEIREAQITVAIVQGYQRIPPTPEEDAWAKEAGDAMITEERWP